MNAPLFQLYDSKNVIRGHRHPKTTWTDEEGGGVSQMTILLHKPYLVKVTTKGERGLKYPKNWPRGLWMTP